MEITIYFELSKFQHENVHEMYTQKMKGKKLHTHKMKNDRMNNIFMAFINLFQKFRRDWNSEFRMIDI